MKQLYIPEEVLDELDKIYPLNLFKKIKSEKELDHLQGVHEVIDLLKRWQTRSSDTDSVFK